MKRLLLLSLAAVVLSGYRAQEPVERPSRETDTEAVGRRGPNRTVLPVNQVVTPLGTAGRSAGPAAAGPRAVA